MVSSCILWGGVSLLIAFLVNKQITYNAILGMLIPITKQSYWFVSCYVLLICLQPMLNLIIEKTDEKQLKCFVIELIFLFSIVPTFLPWSKGITSSGTDVIWFITIYFLMAYVKKYGNEISLFQNKAFGWYLMVLGIVIGVILDYISVWILHRININNVEKIFYFNNSTMFLAAAFGLFLIFKNMDNNKISRWVCVPASTTFGIYLLHDNPLVRENIWEILEKIFPYSQSLITNIMNCFLKVVVIFMIGMIVELIRQYLFKKLKIDELSSWADTILDKIRMIVCG